MVFLTAHLDISTTVKAIRAGADNVLVKPVTSDELLRAIRGAIARHERERPLSGERWRSQRREWRLIKDGRHHL
jgi:FixJ family two-component response regulator